MSNYNELTNELIEDWNQKLNNGKLARHEPIYVYRNKSSFDYTNCIKVEKPLEFKEDKLNDLVSGKVKKIFVKLEGNLKWGLFQLDTDETLEKDKATVRELDDSRGYISSYSFFGGNWTKDKNIYNGSIEIIQHQEVSVEWFIKVLKLKKHLEENEEYIEGDDTIIGFLDWHCEMKSFADEIGLNTDPGDGWSDGEMGLVRHGVSLTYNSVFTKKEYEVASAIVANDFIGGDIWEEVLFKY